MEEEEEEEQEMKWEQAMSHVREYLGRAGGGWKMGAKNNPMSLNNVWNSPRMHLKTNHW